MGIMMHLKYVNVTQIPVSCSEPCSRCSTGFIQKSNGMTTSGGQDPPHRKIEGLWNKDDPQVRLTTVSSGKVNKCSFQGAIISHMILLDHGDDHDGRCFSSTMMSCCHAFSNYLQHDTQQHSDVNYIVVAAVSAHGLASNNSLLQSSIIFRQYQQKEVTQPFKICANWIMVTMIERQGLPGGLTRRKTVLLPRQF